MKSIFHSDEIQPLQGCFRNRHLYHERCSWLFRLGSFRALDLLFVKRTVEMCPEGVES